MNRLEIGVASRTMLGETESADRHVVRVDGQRALIAVVDGLGHGQGAVRAALAAVQMLETTTAQPPAMLLRQLHERLHATRGVVIGLAVVDLRAASLQWLGVGNVAGLLIGDGADAPRRRSMVQLGGVVGHALPALHVESLAIVPGDTLVFATDGVDAAFERDLNGRVPVQPLAQRLLAVHGRGSDDALVLVVRIVGGEP